MGVKNAYNISNIHPYLTLILNHIEVDYFFSELSAANTSMMADKRHIEGVVRGLQQEMDDIMIRYLSGAW